MVVVSTISANLQMPSLEDENRLLKQMLEEAKQKEENERLKKELEASKKTKKSSRWETTQSTAAAQITPEAAKEIARSNIAHREAKADEKKFATVRSAVSFGNEIVKYESTAKSALAASAKPIDPSERLQTLEQAAKMKVGLSVATVDLTTGHSVSYETTTKSALKQSARYGEAVKHITTKDMNNKPAIYFGNESVDYKSETMRAQSGDHDISTHKARMAEVAAMKESRLKKHFSFGEAELDYKSNSQRTYVPIAPEVYKSSGKEKMKEYLDDTRKCHFTLGQDKTVYQSQAQAALLEGSSRDPRAIKEAIEHHKQMKTILTQTSITLGVEEEEE